jgi:hypothetical protein
MLTPIGVMLGCYILVQMLALLTRPADRRENGYVLIAALLTCLVTAGAMVSLLAGPSPLR